MKLNITYKIKHAMEKFYKALLLSIISLSLLALASCEKEQKKYDGDAQLAFSNSTYKMNVTAQTGSITIPIQLIAQSSMEAGGTVKTDPASTCADAVSYTPQFNINPSTFSYNLVVTLDYAALAPGNNTLILYLESNMKIAKYYGKATITLVK